MTISSLEIASYFDARADIWDSLQMQTAGELSDFIGRLHVLKGERVLDVACGTGIITGLLAEASGAAECGGRCAVGDAAGAADCEAVGDGGRGLKVVGIDIAPKMIEKAQEKYAGRDEVEFICADFLEFAGAAGPCSADALASRAADAPALCAGPCSADAPASRAADAPALCAGSCSAGAPASRAADAQALCAGPTTAARFDYVVIFNAYPHFLDPTALSTALATVLAPGGRFAILHSHSRAWLTDHHNKVAPGISRVLGPVDQESCYFTQDFTILAAEESAEHYLIIGARR